MYSACPGGHHRGQFHIPVLGSVVGSPAAAPLRPGVQFDFAEEVALY